MSNLTDDQLRRRLLDLGEQVGPITDTTRALYQKRLNRLLQEKNGTSGGRKSLNSARRLASFSSDESEDSQASESSVASSTASTSRLRRRRTVSGSRTSTVATRSKPTSPETPSTSFKVPSLPPSRTSTPRAGPSRSTPKSSTPLSVDVPTNSLRKNTLTRPGLRHLRDNKSFYDVDTSDTDGEVTTNRSLPIRGSQTTPANSIPTGIFGKINGFQRADDSTLRGEFQTEENQVTNYSHRISMFLVAVVSIFFISLLVVYFVKHKESELAIDYPLDDCSKDAKSYRCQEAKAIQNIINVIHHRLSEAAINHECKDKTASRDVAVDVLQSLIKKKVADLSSLNSDQLFYRAIMKIEDNPSWGIGFKLKSLVMEKHSVMDISSLELATIQKPFICRLQLAVGKAMQQIVALIILLMMIGGIFYGWRHLKKKKELEEREVTDMMQGILAVLQQHANTEDPDPGIPLPHIREMIIPPNEKDSKSHIWEKAVLNLSANDSRIGSEERLIDGEMYRVWKWLPGKVDKKTGRVWHGQAFSNNVNPAAFSPTPCLKIRNMFDPDVEYGQDWTLYIRDAILEKCEGVDGIVHIAIDPTSKEGCVYVKCNSMEAAGEAFRNIHGWWFDGNLITVKYLRLERYHERFPDSTNSATSLKPSNNKRLSLASPFHSSPLERS